VFSLLSTFLVSTFGSVGCADRLVDRLLVVFFSILNPTNQRYFENEKVSRIIMRKDELDSYCYDFGPMSQFYN
jgi:hypothetical protein